MIPLELSFHHIENTEPMEELVREKVDHLERVAAKVNACRVAVERPHSSRTDSPGKERFRVRVDVTVPNSKELVAVKSETDVEPHQDVYVGIREAFAAVERQVKRHAERVTASAVAPAGSPLGHIQELFFEEDYGFIRSADDREIYFHRNAVAGGDFDDLEVGQAVRYTETLTERGPKATHVRPQRREATAAGVSDLP